MRSHWLQVLKQYSLVAASFSIVLETRIATKLDPSTVLVVEDSPAGIASGLAAGCQVITVCTGPVKEAESVKIARTNSDGIHVVRDLTQ